MYHSQDSHPHLRDSAELFRRCEDIVLSLASTTPVIPDSPSALAYPILWRSPDAGITLVKLFGGIGTDLAAVLEVGLTVRQYVYMDNSQVSTRVARHHFHKLMVSYPQQLHLTAIRRCSSCLPRDVTLINEAELRHLGPVDMVIAGWPCQGHSRARGGRGLEDPRSSLFGDLMRLMQWWFSHQSSPPRYIFEKEPFLGDSWDKVLEGRHYVCQHLRDPIFVNVASLGSYAHRPEWIWTNLAPSSILAAAFFAMPPPFDQKVDDILDPNRASLSVVQDDLPPLALLNKVETLGKAFPTFMTFPKSFAFRDQGPGMVWNDERKRAMGFRSGTTIAPGVSKGQRRFVLGQAMNLHTMVWNVDLCLALQPHHGD